MNIIICKIELIIGCFYLLLKYTGLSLIFDLFCCLLKSLFSIINSILGRRLYVRINPFFVYNKRKKKINQSLSFKGLFTIIKKDYGLNHFSKCKDLFKYNKATIKKLSFNNEISFITSPRIFNKLKNDATENSIKLEILKETKITRQPQPIERSSLITTRFLIKSLLNKDDRQNVKKFLFENLEITKYFIKITKNSIPG